MKKKRKGFTRRQLLALLGTAGAYGVTRSPVGLLAETIVNGMARKGFAGDPDGPALYVHFSLQGAPAPYCILPLTPMDGDLESRFVHNPYVGNRLRYDEETGVFRPEYTTTRIGAFHYPAFWDASMPIPGGRSVPLHKFLVPDGRGGSLFFRGTDLGIDGHALCNIRLLRPINLTSLNGEVAALTDRYIPALSMNGTAGAEGGFSSPSGGSQVLINQYQEAPIEQLMAPFRRVAGSFLTEGSVDNALEAAIEAAVSNVEQEEIANNQKLSALRIDRRNAKGVLKRRFPDLVSFWTETRAKYLDLIRRSIVDLPIPGVSDLPIDCRAEYLSFPNSRFYNFMPTGRLNNADLRTIFSLGMIPGLAESCTIAEFAIREGLSRAIVIPGSNILLRTEGPGRVELLGQAPPDGARSFDNDQHNIGGCYATVGNCFYWRAILACAHELRSVATSDPSVGHYTFDISGEFNRIPRNDGSGSDHGPAGFSRLVATSRMRGNHVVGNIFYETRPGQQIYTGTWGESCPFFYPSTPIENNLFDVAATIAQLNGTPSPAPNGQSFLQPRAEDDGTFLVRASYRTPRNVAR